MGPARTILHLDLDAFYASVEQRDDPSLRGRPVVVGGSVRRGVVCAASYEARRAGVRSAMPMARAVALCPDVVVLPPRMDHYAGVSRAFFAILAEHTPLIEKLSLDEAFLDVTASARLFGPGPDVAARIRARVRAELGLTVSAGVAPCKLVAKIASDVGKPDGLVVVAPDEVEGFLAPLPAGRLWGVGEVTGERLAALGVRTIGDLVRVGELFLRGAVGADGARDLVRLARGDDDRPVEPDRAPVSAGSEVTFDDDVRDREVLGWSLLAHADRACARLRADDLRARTVTVKVKYADHQLVTRRATLAAPTCDARRIGDEAVRLLGEVPAIERRGVRLTGISLSGLVARSGPGQLLLDERGRERGETLGDTLDKIRGRFGGGAVVRAVHVRSPEDEPGRGARKLR